MASASSSFVGTESPLSEGGAWTALTAYWQHMRKATGAAVDSAVLGNDCAARYTGVTFTADHYSEIVLTALPTGGQLFFQYALVRMSATASCYELTTAPDVGSNMLQLWKLDNTGAGTQIGANIALGSAMVAGDVARLEAIGTTLNVRYNGTIVRTATDTTLTTGQPGIGGWAQNSGSNVILITSWNAADIVASVSSTSCRSRNPSWHYSV